MKRFRFTLTALAVIAVIFLIHRCTTKRTSIPQPPVVSQPVIDSSAHGATALIAPPETTTVRPFDKLKDRLSSSPAAAVPNQTAVTEPARRELVESVEVQSMPSALSSEPEDSIPYVYADPWGGRHFDSVTVNLHCAQNCPILYSLQDSVNLKPYHEPITFRSDATLWFTGTSSRGYRAPIVQLDYVIEKNPKFCPDGAMPVAIRGHEICVDVYEWPDREGAKPAVMVSHEQAEDSCEQVGKHLCSLEEWQSACHGPEELKYPYGDNYNERYCPAQQSDPSRSGRFPACRSYYGIFDLAGNVWEWTSTVDPDHTDFYYVAGGAWSAADNATCSMAKYSFYPQNLYPTVGFRCCDKVK